MAESDTPNQNDENIEKLGDLIKDIRIAMLTTADKDGTLRSRPMGTLKTPFDGDLWFFTSSESPKVGEVEREHQVNLSYADPGGNTYVSVSGRATLVRDRAKMEALWSPALKAWFPNELDEPDIALLRVHVEKAEYWDQAHGKVVQLFGFVRAVLTGQRYYPGENEKIDLDTA